MSYQSTDVYVLDSTPANNPVEGVLVRVFDETNVNFITEAATNADGLAGFTLFTATYNLRFYKFGVQVPQPQVAVVQEPVAGQPLLNAFNAYATIFEHPISNDVRLCRASGFFRDVTGAPQPNLDIHIIAQFAPILLEGSAVLSERRVLRTDKDGFACVDLIRCAKYSAMVQGHEDTLREVEVPDSPSVNLPDLLFPLVESVSFDVAGPYDLLVGETIELTPIVVASNGVPLIGVGAGDVQWGSSDESVLSVATTATTVTLTGKAAGTAELQASRLNTSIIHIPETTIQGVPQAVTVT